MVKFSPVQFFKKIGKKKLLIALGVVLLVIGALGGVYYYQYVQDKNREALIAAETKAAYDKFNEVNKLQLQALNGDLKGAAEILLTQLKDAKTDDEKIAAYNQLSSIYLDAKDLKLSSEYANSANKVKDNAESWSLLGHVAELSGDWSGAVVAYQKAVDLSGSSGDAGRDQPNDYLNSLNYAKAHKS